MFADKMLDGHDRRHLHRAGARAAQEPANAEKIAEAERLGRAAPFIAPLTVFFRKRNTDPGFYIPEDEMGGWVACFAVHYARYRVGLYCYEEMVERWLPKFGVAKGELEWLDWFVSGWRACRARFAETGTI